MLFGRHWIEGGLPIEIPQSSVSAEEFMQKMDDMDRKLCQYYNDKHKKQEISYNKEMHHIRYPYQIGDWVWVLRDPNPGKMETWWVGPCKVIKRVGEYSYQISTHPTRLDSVWMYIGIF